jgi:hypothetical protein
VKLFLLGATAHAMIRIFAALLLLVFVGRPQLAEADISPKKANSRFEPGADMRRASIPQRSESPTLQSAVKVEQMQFREDNSERFRTAWRSQNQSCYVQRWTYVACATQLVRY